MLGEVEIRVQDCRDLAADPFDAICSVGMYVAVVVTSRSAGRMSAADLNRHVREHRGMQNKKH
jgi:cyclopropane fatty-acyl-phospholipid synthase-like methyltransferase